VTGPPGAMDASIAIVERGTHGLVRRRSGVKVLNSIALGSRVDSTSAARGQTPLPSTSSLARGSARAESSAASRPLSPFYPKSNAPAPWASPTDRCASQGNLRLFSQARRAAHKMSRGDPIAGGSLLRPRSCSAARAIHWPGHGAHRTRAGTQRPPRAMTCPPVRVTVRAPSGIRFWATMAAAGFARERSLTQLARRSAFSCPSGDPPETVVGAPAEAAGGADCD